MIKKFIEVILGFVFAVFLSIFLFVFVFDFVVFNDQTYFSDEFIDKNYEIIEDEIFISFNSFEKYSDYFTKNEFSLIFREVFTKEDLKNEVSAFIESIKSTKFDSDNEFLKIDISFSFWENYLTEFVSLFAVELFENIPRCDNLTVLENCIPTLLSFDIFEKELTREIDLYLSQNLLFDIQFNWHIDKSFSNNLLETYKKIKNYLTFFLFGILVFNMLIFLIINNLSVIKSFKTLSISSFLSAILNLIIIKLVPIFEGTSYKEFFLFYLVNDIFKNFLFFSLMLLSVSFLIFILSFFLDRKKQYV